MDKHNRYLYFLTKDYTGTNTTSGYSLPICPFTFIPVFDDGTPEYYSEQNILWDFGDGTTSEALTAQHYFKLPGWYDVKCYFLGKDGIGYEDSFSQSIMVRDFISDTIVLSGRSSSIVEAGLPQSPYTIIRFNSWQTYPALSSVGYTVNLHISGNTANTLDTAKYNKDKWGHLKPTSRFTTELFNIITEKYEFLPVNTIQTNNVELYARVFQNELSICSKDLSGSIFVGTSGSKDFYYIDDIPKQSSEAQKAYSSSIFASFDTKQFKDYDSYGKNYGEVVYNTLNSIYDSNAFSKTIGNIVGQQFKLAFSSNGIDDDNDGNAITTFDIDSEKYVGQKIPFIVRYKNEIPINIEGGIDFKEFPLKYFGLLGLATQSNELTGNNIELTALDTLNNTISGAYFFTNYGILSSEVYGGYFRGYVIFDREIRDVRIYAKGLPTIVNSFFAETTHAIIGEPASEKLHNLTIRTDITNPLVKTLDDAIVDITGLSGVYTTCITTKRDIQLGLNESHAWLVDSDSDKVRKYNPDTMLLEREFSLYNDFGILSASPSNICGDADNNVWITLYDSISTIKIGNDTNIIDAIIVPSLANEEYEGENTISPASVDVDKSGNVWVSYTSELSSFVEKYTNSGGFLKHVQLSANYKTTELIIDVSNNAWVILKDTTAVNDLSAKNDKVVKINSAGTSVVYYNVGGSLYNITNDANDNIWITKNRNEVARINTLTSAITSFTLSSNSSSDRYISDLEGIACQSDNTILVVDDYNKVLHYFDAKASDHITESLLLFSDIGINGIDRKITAYGDWNGFRCINKFCKIEGLVEYREGTSNKFSVYSSLSGKYDLRKINENFDPATQIKSYRFQEYLQNNTRLFDDLIGTAVGTLTSSPNELGKKIYEKISNYSSNIADVDTCNIDVLKSMYEMLGDDIVSFHGSDLSIPANLYRLMDLFSINFSKLKGSRNKWSLDFDDKGYDNDSLRQKGRTVNFGKNKGAELNFLTTTLTATDVYIVVYEKFSSEYRLVNIDLPEYSTLTYSNSALRTFSLSSYSPDWGWNLILPDSYTLSSYEIPRYYTFFSYISSPRNNQTEGLINWGDEYTTIKETLTSTDDWDYIRETMIAYTLARGLDII